MAKSFDLQLALNAEIGKVPLSMSAEVAGKPDETVYTFNGNIKDFDIKLGDFVGNIGNQFGVQTQLPPELQAAEFKIDYLTGQVILTKPKTGTNKTHLEIAGKFEFKIGNLDLAWEFFAAGDRDPANTTQPYIVGFALDVDFPFSSLPVVGKVPGLADLKLTKIGFTYAKSDSGKPVKFSIPNVDPNTLKLQPGDQDSEMDGKGFSITVGLVNTATNQQINNFALPMALPASTSTPTQPTNPFYSGKTSPPADPVHWIDIDKTFGPVSLKKIGLNYSDGNATFGFSAGFAVSAFVLDVQGLTITFPLPLAGNESKSSASFDLAGLGIDIKKGGLEIGGGFLKSVDANNLINYYGQVIVKAGGFGLSAVGGYAPDQVIKKPNQPPQNVPASFFLFANINIPLGGPPFFFVTGFAGGFGINRNLLLPTIDQLPAYPLLPHNANANLPVGGTAKDSLSTVLPALATIFENKPGEYWIAAGIQFTSFEMIDAFALVTVAFGVDVQVALLGQISMTFPKGDTEAPLAYIEIDILVSVNPELGQFALDGRLTPASNIFDGLCHISGGFAFYFWFDGPNRGDFVVSIGGYHPAFVKPDNYPTVPRLSMQYALGPFQMGGEAYFALTPAMMMAGLRVYATWNAGPLKAWFDAGFDFLLGWAPFHYEADAYVHIGISLDLLLFTISIHVGVDLELWGPEFGGLAHIDLDIVTFTIEFGAPRSAPPPVGWSDFEKSFLPSNAKKPTPLSRAANTTGAAAADSGQSTKIGASVTDGLDTDQNIGNLSWIVKPNKFVISLSSTIPSNNLSFNSGVIKNDTTVFNQTGSAPYLQTPKEIFSSKDKLVWNPALNIGPMNKQSLESFLDVTLVKQGEQAMPDNAFTLEPVLTDVPEALWGPQVTSANKNPNLKRMLPKALTGLLLSPIPRHPDIVSDIPLALLIFQQDNLTAFFYATPAVDSGFTVKGALSNKNDTLTITITAKTPVTPPPNSPLTNTGYCLSALEDTWIAGRRNQVLDALDADPDFQTWSKAVVNMPILATQTALTDWPSVALLGDDSYGNLGN